MQSIRTCCLLVALCVALSCATTPSSGDARITESEPDVVFEVDAFLAPPGLDGWAAWTEKGLVVSGELLASRGDGCVPEKGWPGILLFVPGEHPGIWLYGTEPQMSGEALGTAGDKITFDCVAQLDGRTRPGSTVPARLVDKPDPDDNFGFAPVPWHQSGQAPSATMATPAGPMEWELSAERKSCWLVGQGDNAWSACLPTAQHEGFELKSWQMTPEGLAVAGVRTFELPGLRPGEARVWLEAPGRVVVSATTTPGQSTVWSRNSETETSVWTREAVKLEGAVTSAVFDGDEAVLLTVDFDENAHRLVRMTSFGVDVRKLPEDMRPTKLHLADDGTLWGAGIGAAWRLSD